MSDNDSVVPCALSLATFMFAAPSLTYTVKTNNKNEPEAERKQESERGRQRTQRTQRTNQRRKGNRRAKKGRPESREHRGRTRGGKETWGVKGKAGEQRTQRTQRTQSQILTPLPFVSKQLVDKYLPKIAMSCPCL